jgi:hypothetical protein
MHRAGAVVAIAFGLAGCAIASDASPPTPESGSPWAIERQVQRCRANQSGGTRTSTASAGGLTIAGSVTAISRTETEATESCPAILALTDADVGEIRTLVQATAASARGLDTNWQSPTGARREITLSVYPEAGRAGQACRMVAATLTVFHGVRGATLGAPPPAPLDEQRLCRGETGPWEPS